MMKKTGLILLLNVYALAVFGIGIKQFFCCGILKSTGIAFTQPREQKCNEGGEKEGCCKIEYKNLKVKDTHFAASETNAPAKQIADLHICLPLLETTIASKHLQSIEYPAHAPPLLHGQKLYILLCTYRI